MIDTDYRQIRAIASQSSDPSAFFREFVQAFAHMTPVELGLAWNCEEQPYRPICQVYRDADAMVKLPISSARHQEILTQTRTKSAAELITTESSDGQPVPSILICPLRRASMTAIIEFILPAANSSADNQAVQQALDDCRRIVSEHQSTSDSRQQSPADYQQSLSSSSELSLQDLDDFTRLVHESPNLDDTARQIANESRRIWRCDRVTVLRLQKRKYRALAISGQSKVNQRSNELKALTKLADAVLRTTRALWFPTTESFPPQIQAPLDAYIRASLTRSLAVIPLYDRPEEALNATAVSQPRVVIGGMVIEQANNQWDRGQVEPSIAAIANHAEIAFRNAYQLDRVFLLPVWRAMGQWKSRLTATFLQKALLAIVVIGLLLSALIYVPTDFHLVCEGNLAPLHRQRIFAHLSGTVRSVEVTHGDLVTEGQLLLMLENDELEIQRQQLQGERNTLQERLTGDRSIRINRRARSDDGSNREVSQKEVQAQIASLDRRLATIDTQAEKLKVRSPLPGRVLTWDVVNRLRDRPVQQGNLLMEVADTGGAMAT